MTTEVLVPIRHRSPQVLLPTTTEAPEPELVAEPQRQRVSLGPICVDSVDQAAAVERIRGFATSGRPHQIVTVNLDFVSIADRDPAFRELINAADLAEPGELMQLVRYVTRATSGSDNKYGSLTRQLSNRIKRLPDPPSVSISLLLDNSGSMRGEKIVSLAGAMIVLIDWLERWHIGLHDPSLEGRAV